jgi:hypothetical protein
MKSIKAFIAAIPLLFASSAVAVPTTPAAAPAPVRNVESGPASNYWQLFANGAYNSRARGAYNPAPTSKWQLSVSGDVEFSGDLDGVGTTKLSGSGIVSVAGFRLIQGYIPTGTSITADRNG